MSTDVMQDLRRRCAGTRIAYVCADPGIGVFGTKGAAVHIQAVVRTLRRAGAHVEVFAVKTGGQAPADLADLPVHLLPSHATASDPRSREQQLISADARTPDALAAAGDFDLYYERYSLFSAAGAQWATARGTPVIVEVNAPLIDEHTQHRGLHHPRAAEHALVALLDATDLAACVSEPVRTWVTGRAPQTPTVVVPNGADVHRIRPRPGRTRTAGATAVPTIGFVGTLKPWHGVDVLLEAAAPLLTACPGLPHGARLLIVGDGPLADQVDHRAARLGIQDQVDRTGAVPPAQVPQLLTRMDLGVAPYPADAGTYFSPLKVLEYLAAGLPVVGSAVGQLSTLVDHGRTGLLVPASDIAALRSALTALLTDPARRRRMGAAARAAAVRKHSWEQTVAATLAAVPGRRGTAPERAGEPAPSPITERAPGRAAA